MKMTRISPLLACGIAALAACSTPLVPEATNGFSGAPKVVAVYAIDPNYGLPDVLVYSATEPAKASKAPPVYAAYRIEFDQPMGGGAGTNNADLSGQTYCSVPSGGNTVQLLDVANSNTALASSLCYDPTSALGQNPHVTLYLGAGSSTATAASPSPFTCQDFSPESAGEALKPKTQYALQFKSGLAGSNGKALDTTGLPINFTTAGFDIMAVGYQDQNTGYFVWLDKPYAGFMKDLAAASDFTMPDDDTPMYIITTLPAKNADITITRDDGSDLRGGADFSGPITVISPGYYWEAGAKYKMTVQPTYAGDTDETIPAASAKTYSFSAASDSFAKRTTSPSNAATAVSVRPSLAVTFTVPLDPSLVDNTHFKLTGPEGDVVLHVSVSDGADNELVSIAPQPPSGQLSALRAESKYTLTWTGLKTPPACTSTNPDTPAVCVPGYMAAKPVTDGSISFTTATFRTADVQTTGNSSINNVGTAPVDTPVTGTQIIFTDAPDASTVTTDTLKLFEVHLDGSTTPVATGLTGPSATGRGFVLKASDANYTLKFGQAYKVTASTNIKNQAAPAANGINLKAEGCNAGQDCTDVRAYTTRKWAPVAPFAADETGMELSFNSSSLPPIDPSTTNLNTHFHLYKVNADGSRGDEVFAGQLTCAFNGTKKIDCSYPSGGTLTSNAKYLATVVWTKDAPLLPASTYVGHPVDRDVNSPTGGAWFGTQSVTFTTSCPATP